MIRCLLISDSTALGDLVDVLTRMAMNLLLVGCGNYAKEAHLHGISTFEKTGHQVVLSVADLEHPAINPHGLDGNSWFIQLDKRPERSEVIL